MNFNEIYEKYINGKATPKELKLIEEETERLRRKNLLLIEKLIENSEA